MDSNDQVVLDLLAETLLREKNLRTFKKDGGKGGFGMVLFVEDANDPDKKYAVKAQNIMNYHTNKIDQQKLISCEQEANVMRECAHKNIIKLIDEFQIESYHYIQMNLCNSSLEGWIAENGSKKITNKLFNYYAQQIIDGIELLHKKDYIVRDLSVRNILLITNGSIIQLCDFGLAKKDSVDVNPLLVSQAGPKGVMFYFAPENYSLQSSSEGVKQTKEGDIWALGICLKLFGGVSFQQLLQFIGNKYRTTLVAPNLNQKCNRFIDYILNPNPTQRPTIQQIREMAFVEFIENEDDEDLNRSENETSQTPKGQQVYYDNYSEVSTNDNLTVSSKSLNAGNYSAYSSQGGQFQKQNQNQDFLTKSQKNNLGNQNQYFSINSNKNFNPNNPNIQRLVDFNYLEAESLIERYTKFLKNNPNDCNCLITLGFLEARFNCNFKKADEYFQTVREINEDDVDCYLGMSTIIIQQSQKRKYQLIQQYLDKCFLLRKDYWRLYYYQSWLFFIQQRYNDSMQQLAKAIDLEDSSPHLLSLKAMIFSTCNRRQDGMVDINKAVQLNKWNDPSVYFRKGFIYHRIEKDPFNAVQFYKQALQSCEKDMMSIYNLVYLYHEQGRKLEEDTLSQKAIQLYPQSNRINYLLGSISKDINTAIRYFIRATELDPTDVDSYECLAKIFLEKNEFSNALSYYSLILDQDQKNIEVLRQMGLIEMEKTKNYDKAIYYYKRAIDASQKLDINAELCIGILYSLKNQDQLSIQQLEKVIKEDPKFHRGHLELGRVYQKVKYEDQAISTYLKALQLNKDDQFSSYQIGIIYKEQKRYTLAIPHFENAIRINPKDSYSLFYIGYCLYEQNKLQDGVIKYLKKALEINPNHTDAYQMLGDSFFERKDYQSAKFYLYKTIELCKTKLSTTYFQLAEIENENEKIDESIFNYKKCIELDANNLAANYKLAMLYRSKKDFINAWHQFQKVLTLNPKHVSSIFNLGYIYQEGKNDDDGAVKYYLKTIEVDDKFIVAYYNLGKIYEKKLNIIEAYKNYEKVLLIDPKYKYADHCQKYIDKNRMYMQQLNKKEGCCNNCTIF